MKLVPVHAQHRGEARAAVAGVEVRADTGDADRPWSVPSAFTPVQLSLRNTGSEPVFVGLEDIQLASATAALRAVPAASIAPRRRVASLGMDPGSPFVALQGTAGGEARAYGGRTESVLLQAAPGALYESALGKQDPAQGEISGSAFRAGEIAGGETRTGFVYFRHVPRNAGHLTLRIFVRPMPDAPDASVLEIVYSVRS